MLGLRTGYHYDVIQIDEYIELQIRSQHIVYQALPSSGGIAEAEANSGELERPSTRDGKRRLFLARCLQGYMPISTLQIDSGEVLGVSQPIQKRVHEWQRIRVLLRRSVNLPEVGSTKPVLSITIRC